MSPLQALAKLREALTTADLSHADAREANQHLDDAANQLGAGQPDPTRVAGPLERLTKLLTRAGQLTQAGAALVTPLRVLATRLGAHGATLWHLVPAIA